MDAKRNVWKGEEGQAVVEAALTLPIFLFLLCGIFELSYMFVVQAMVDYSAYCAARSGIVRNGDANMMKWAAAQALAPVTQTNYPIDSLGLTLRAEYTGAVSIAKEHLVHWGSTMVARAQFEVQLPSGVKYGSKREYQFEAATLGGMGFTSTPRLIALQALGGFGAGNVATRSNPGGNDSPVYTINDLRILDPDDFNRNPQDPDSVQGTSAGHTYMSIRQFWAATGINNLKEPQTYLLAREPRANEIGETGVGAPYQWNPFLGQGLRLTSTNAAVNKKMRLRVEVIHSHRLLFKFLVPVVSFLPLPQPKYWAYWSTGVDPGVKSKMSKDDAYRNAVGRVLLRGEWTMRMQSNFLERVGRGPQ